MDETVKLLVEEKIRVIAFTRFTAPGFFDMSCGTGRRLPGTEVPAGWSKSYAGKLPIPQATDGQNYDLGLVQTGKLSLATTINEAVKQSHCNPPEPPK